MRIFVAMASVFASSRSFSLREPATEGCASLNPRLQATRYARAFVLSERFAGGYLNTDFHKWIVCTRIFHNAVVLICFDLLNLCEIKLAAGDYQHLRSWFAGGWWHTTPVAALPLCGANHKSTSPTLCCGFRWCFSEHGLLQCGVFRTRITTMRRSFRARISTNNLCVPRICTCCWCHTVYFAWDIKKSTSCEVCLQDVCIIFEKIAM